MNRIFIALVPMIALIFIFPLHSNADQSPQRFISIVDELKDFVISEDIKIDTDEKIEDIVTIGYFSALKITNSTFGSISDKIRGEMINWYSIMCWLPGVPEDKKKKTKNDLKKIRKALVKGAYERTLASMIIYPKFAITSKNEIYLPDAIFEKYSMPDYWNAWAGDAKLWGVYAFSFQDIKSAINSDKMVYKDIINVDWSNKFLK